VTSLISRPLAGPRRLLAHLARPCRRQPHWPVGLFRNTPRHARTRRQTRHPPPRHLRRRRSPPPSATVWTPPATVSTSRTTPRPSRATDPALRAREKLRSARLKASDREDPRRRAWGSNGCPRLENPRGRPWKRHARCFEPCRCEVARVGREGLGVGRKAWRLAGRGLNVARKAWEVRAREFWGCGWVSAAWYPLRWVRSQPPKKPSHLTPFPLIRVTRDYGERVLSLLVGGGG